jgi:hypothetical protein
MKPSSKFVQEFMRSYEQEFMRSYEDATSRPHGYLMLDLSQQQTINNEIVKFLHKQSYRQPPLVNAMYDAEQRMKEIMEAPQLSVVEKRKLYSDQLNRFLTFKNKMDIPAQSPVQRTSLVSPTPLSAEIPPQVPPTAVPAEILSPVPATPKPNFLTPPPTEGKRPKLRHNFFTIG